MFSSRFVHGFLLLGTLAATAFAQPSSGNMGNMGNMGNGRMGPGGMHGMHGMQMMSDSGMCPGWGMMMQMAVARQVVPTQDGGVVVVVGNALRKYDKNLKLLKEVEIEVDWDKLQQQMQQMQQRCPMMQPGGSQQTPSDSGASQPKKKQ